jgi:hypothetical protein
MVAQETGHEAIIIYSIKIYLQFHFFHIMEGFAAIPWFRGEGAKVVTIWSISAA